MSRTTSATNDGAIAAELWNWARMPFDRGCGGVPSRPPDCRQ